MAKARVLSIRLAFLEAITHEKGDTYVKNGQNCEGVTKRPVHDVPELKHLLRVREEEYVLGERGLLLCDANGTLELLVSRREQAAEREQPGTESRLLQAHQRSLEGAFEVDLEHGKAR